MNKINPNQSSAREGKKPTFNEQYNALALRCAQLERVGATPQKVRNYTDTYPISSREGQWKIPYTHLTPDDMLTINRAFLGK